MTWFRCPNYSTQLDRIEAQLMALADTLAAVAADDQSLKDELAKLTTDVTDILGLVSTEKTQIADLQAQIAALQAGNITPEQITALQANADSIAASNATLENLHTQIAGALNPPA